MQSHIITVWGERYRFTPISTMYVDFGLQIDVPDPDAPDGWREVFYNPCCLDRLCWGVTWTHDDDPDTELAEGIPWTDADWREAFESEAGDLIEAYLGD